MERKIVSCALCSLLLVSAGCFSTAVVTMKELETTSHKADVTLFMKDSAEYKFLQGNYHVQGDSISGFGLQTRGPNSDIVLNASLSFGDVRSMEAKQFNLGKTVLLGGAIAVTALVITKFLFFNHEAEQAITPSGGGTH